MSSGDKKRIATDLFNSATTYNREIGIPATKVEVSWAYFLYLCEKMDLNGTAHYTVRTPETDHLTYFELALKLHSTPFNVFIIRDENRATDGKNIRGRFAAFHSSFSDYSILDTKPCSMLEMLIALCERYDTENMMTEETGSRSKVWFWELLHNAGLDIFTDDFVDSYTMEGISSSEIMDKIVSRINKREYNEDGSGGFFPLRTPKRDQRITELWYQMHEYMHENYPDEW